MPADTPDLAALDALYRAATPGPWDARPEQNEHGLTGAWIVSGDSVSIRVRAPNGEQGENNAALIAALHNAWPALRRELEIGRAAVEVCDLTADLRSLWEAMGSSIEGATEAYDQRHRDIDAARAKLRALRETKDA